MARPKKIKSPPSDLRAFDRPQDDMKLAHISRQMALDAARVDPLGDEPLSCVLAPVILKRASASDKELAGKMFVHLLENGTADQAEAFFKRAVTLKRNAEGLPHRNGFAYYGYSMFIEENGFEPTRARLKKYILARPEIYREAPRSQDTKGWLRVWEESGLFALE